MLTVEQALNEILATVQTLETVEAALLDALGRTLAEDITADIPLPPFSNSAVDGYAVRAADTVGATPAAPVLLRVAGEITAGQTAGGPLEPGSAIRIMTGAPIPAGAEAIVMVEDTRRSEATGAAETVAITAPAVREQHIRREGEDVSIGTCVLAAGTRLRPAEIAMLAAMGRATVAVVRPPRVAVITTGDEVVDIQSGVVPESGKIRNSNRYLLASLIQEAGAQLHSLRHVPDDPDATEAALKACAGDDTAGGPAADVIISAGGVSVGDRDFVRPALEKLGSLTLWRVAMKPGKPVAFGRIGPALFFGLPGNPVSVMVTFELFARPALWKMAGRSESELARRTVRARVGRSIAHTQGRREYVRAWTEQSGEEFVSTPTGQQGSGVLRSLTLANSLLIVPEDSPGLSAGDTADVLLLE